MNNCGKPFRLEVASRDFEHDYKKLLARSHPKVQEKLKAMLKKWAEGEFKGDPQFGLIPSLYNTLKREGVDFSGGSDQPKKAAVPKDPNVVSSQQEEDDIAKAIQASLQDAGGPVPEDTGERSRRRSSKTSRRHSTHPWSSAVVAAVVAPVPPLQELRLELLQSPRKRVLFTTSKLPRITSLHSRREKLVRITSFSQRAYD